MFFRWRCRQGLQSLVEPAMHYIPLSRNEIGGSDEEQGGLIPIGVAGISSTDGWYVINLLDIPSAFKTLILMFFTKI